MRQIVTAKFATPFILCTGLGVTASPALGVRDPMHTGIAEFRIDQRLPVRPDSRVDRDLQSPEAQTRAANDAQIESLQTRVTRLSNRCEQHATDFCKDVSEMNLELKELRGEKRAPEHIALSLQAFDNRLQRVERRFVAE